MSNLLFSKHSLPGETRGLVVLYCDWIKISCAISEAWQSGPDHTCWCFLFYTFNPLQRKPSLHWFHWKIKKSFWTCVHNQPDARSNSSLVIGGNDSILHWRVCLMRWQFEANHFQNGVFRGLNNVLPGRWNQPLSLPHCCEWCVTEAKPRVHAKMHLTTAALIGLQPEDLKFASGSCGTKTTSGDCRGWDIYTAGCALRPEPTHTAAGESIQ